MPQKFDRIIEAAVMEVSTKKSHYNDDKSRYYNEFSAERAISPLRDFTVKVLSDRNLEWNIAFFGKGIELEMELSVHT